MHIGVISDSWLESFALKANMVADPLLKTQMAFIMARSIMVAVEIGIFESLVETERTAEEIARTCKAQPRPTRSLLHAMVSCEYLHFSPKTELFSLTPSARKWLTRSSPHSFCDKMLLQNLEWEFMNGLSLYVKEGKSVDLHLSGKPELWKAYQRGMADIGKLALPEIVRRAPIPKDARTMLDIGGSGGTYSAAFVKSRARLSSVILDLPEAVEHAKLLVEAHGLPRDRLEIQAGNALEDDLGTDRYDFVFMGNVAHHLSESQNRALALKVKNALRCGGVYCVLEPKRTDKPSKKTQLGALCDLYFGLTSQSGTWSVAEIASWLDEAGLKTGKPVLLRTAPGAALVYGQKTVPLA